MFLLSFSKDLDDLENRAQSNQNQLKVRNLNMTFLINFILHCLILFLLGDTSEMRLILK